MSELNKKYLFDTLEKVAREAFDKMMSEAHTCSASAGDDTRALTMDSMIRATKLLKKPTLYFASTNFVPKGNLIVVEKTRFSPKYFVCNEEDLPEISRALSIHFELVPLEKYEPTQEDLDAFYAELVEHINAKRTSRELMESWWPNED